MAALYIAYETLILLRRHKVFVPMIVIFAVIGFGASLASRLSVEDFRRILFDFGSFGFHVAGGLIAIFWGAKSMTDSRQEGSLEVQLAAPVSRSTWLVGKFLGLSAALTTLGAIFVVLMQLLMLFFDRGWLNLRELAAFGFILLLMNVLAGLIIFFSSFCNLPVAVFSCLMCWIVGMAAPYLPTGVGTDSDLFTQALGLGLAKYWNLQLFNLSDLVYLPEFPSPTDLAWRLAYGVGMIATVVTCACALFSRRDIVR